MRANQVSAHSSAGEIDSEATRSSRRRIGVAVFRGLLVGAAVLLFWGVAEPESWGEGGALAGWELVIRGDGELSCTGVVLLGGEAGRSEVRGAGRMHPANGRSGGLPRAP